MRGEYSVGLWKAIRKDWDTLNRRLSFIVVNKRRVKFWNDRWCREEPLYVSFPSLYALALSKEARVASLWDQLGEWGNNWNLYFSRNLNNWELDNVE